MQRRCSRRTRYEPSTNWSTWGSRSTGPQGTIAQRAFGGHTKNFGEAAIKRACYAADRTGRVILDTLREGHSDAGSKYTPNSTLLDLLMDQGRRSGIVAYELATGELHLFHARAVLLATGGFGKVYKTTSNCFANTGDGVYLAYRAGIPLEDMEFVQFHPTGIYGSASSSPRRREARGASSATAKASDSWKSTLPTIKDLAPRDMVSRAIMTEIREESGD